MPAVNFLDWYWTIGEDTANVWSSKRAASVPVTDPEYADNWLIAYGGPSNVSTMEELEAIFGVHYPRGSLTAYTAWSRWMKEQAGMTTTSGIPVKTDDRSQAKINGTRLVAMQNPALVTRWRASDGTYHDVDSAGIIAMSDDLQIHINNCFAVASDVQDEITAGTITTHAQIDDAFAAPITRARKDWLKG